MAIVAGPVFDVSKHGYRWYVLQEGCLQLFSSDRAYYLMRAMLAEDGAEVQAGGALELDSTSWRNAWPANN